MRRRILAPLIGMSFAAACQGDLAVHIRGGDRPPNPEHVAPPDGGIVSSDLVLSTGVSVDRFQIVVRSMRLQEAPTDGGVDAPGAVYVGPGPYLVDLVGSSLTGGAFTDLIAGFIIGPRSFYELDITLEPASQGDVELTPALAPLLGKTFVIQGHNAQGAPFRFESSMVKVLVRPSVYRLGTNHNNIDVNIAPNTWFALPDGGVIDPTTTDPALRATIEENVAASIDAYEDDNMDGNPDPLG